MAIGFREQFYGIMLICWGYDHPTGWTIFASISFHCVSEIPLIIQYPILAINLIALLFLFWTGSSSISRYLSQIDSSYASIFGNESWSQLCESASSQDPIQAKAEVQEITNRIQGYLQTAGPCTQIPIAEAMVNYKDEDSCQIFVPFVSVSATDSRNKHSTHTHVFHFIPICRTWSWVQLKRINCLLIWTRV